MIESGCSKEKEIYIKAVLARMPSNVLYFVVLPLIHLASDKFGQTEQVLTLLPDRDFATEFFPDEVDGYVSTFENRRNLLTGGHVTSYEIKQERMANGRVILQVVQNVK